MAPLSLGVDSVVPLPCFGRKLLYAAGIIKAALGFLVRLGGLIAVIATIVSISTPATRNLSLGTPDFHPSNEHLSLGTPGCGRASQCGGVPQ